MEKQHMFLGVVIIKLGTAITPYLKGQAGTGVVLEDCLGKI
jgi:hypothetical protein